MPFDATPVRQDTEVTVTLRRALALIEAGWTQRAFARRDGDFAVDAIDTRAVRFCAIGAMERAVWERTSKIQTTRYCEARRVLIRVANLHGEDPIAEWNDDDSTSWEEVIRVFKQAIEASQTVVRYE